MDKILLIKTSSLGDIVHIYPVVDYLRKKFPAALIDWVVEAPFADLVHSHPYVNQVLTVSTKKWRKNIFAKETWKSIFQFRKQLQSARYDVVFDLQGNMKSGLITSLAYSPCKVGFGRSSVPEWPNLLFTNYRFDPPLYHARESLLSFDSARRSHIEDLRSDRRSPAPRGQGEEEDRFGKVAASQNLANLPEHGMNENIRHDYLSLAASFFKEPIPDEKSHVTLKISEKEKIFLDSICPKRPSVIVCPGSAWRNKQLTPETLSAFLELVKNHMQCHFLFVWGSQEEKELAMKLQKAFEGHSQVVEKMPLPMLQNLMDRSDLVIAMDSLPLHLAGTTKTPSFSVFGASSATKYKPIGTRHYAFQGSCPYGRAFVKRCPILRTCSTGACIRNLQAHDLFEAFKSWWQTNEH
jgi:heptosyltransferase I